MDNPWLIQRGTFQRRENKIGIDRIISFDYMGSAEFEFGALPESFERIMVDNAAYELFLTDIKNSNNVPLMVYCKKEDKEDVLWVIKKLATGSIRLKEYITFQYRIKKSEYPWNKPKENFWWDIQNDFMFFFPADNRVKLFEKALKENVKDFQEKNATVLLV